MNFQEQHRSFSHKDQIKSKIQKLIHSDQELFPRSIQVLLTMSVMQKVLALVPKRHTRNQADKISYTFYRKKRRNHSLLDTFNTLTKQRCRPASELMTLNLQLLVSYRPALQLVSRSLVWTSAQKFREFSLCTYLILCCCCFQTWPQWSALFRYSRKAQGWTNSPLYIGKQSSCEGRCSTVPLPAEMLHPYTG